MPIINLHHPDMKGAELPVKDVHSQIPFREGLEYSCPSRGTWTIAHSSMLLPQGHQIFVGASACLQGVSLSAAEYEGMDRFSMIMIDEKDILSGDMEELFIDGISDIIDNLPYRPRAIMSFDGCIHYFLSTDMDYVYRELRQRFPDIDFLSCHMHPTMKKNEPSVEEYMRTQLYSALRPLPVDDRSINTIGSNAPMDPDGDYMKILLQNGYTVRDLAVCYDYDEYLKMGGSFMNIYSMPSARMCCDTLNKRLGQKELYLPYSWNYMEIAGDLTRLCGELGLDLPDFTAMKNSAESALKRARDTIGDDPVVIDYVSSTRYFGLARLLLEHGFNVKALYGDVVNPDDKPALMWLQQNYPELPLRATKDFKSRFFPRDAEQRAESEGRKVLAIGPKAAYFTGTNYFVNIIENNGMYGFSAIEKLADLMIDAYQNPKDQSRIIQVKGWGCSA